MIRAFLPTMLENGGGSIINIASVLSSVSGAPGRFAYGTSKAALIGMTKSVAADFSGRGVRCNAVCPGAVDTPGLRSRIASSPEPEAALAAFVARHPVGRLGEPEEIAEICVYLASSRGGFMTGQTIVVDGGMTL
jgi:2-keto-3-deoxy-L-fuconate dehydrogenase